MRDPMRSESIGSSMRAALIYPHQLFPEHPAVNGVELCVLVEEPLLLTQYRFHAQKLLLHRASLRQYGERLRRAGMRVRYVEAHELRSTADIADLLKRLDVTHVRYVDPWDDWIERRLARGLESAGLTGNTGANPQITIMANALRIASVIADAKASA